MKTNLSSRLAPLIRRFIGFKRSLGLDYKEQARILLALDRFLDNNGRSFRDLSSDSFLAWCKTFHHLSNRTRRLRMQTVRDFCRYRQRSEPKCFVPDSYLFPTEQARFRPYIFSMAEIRQLLQQCAKLPSRRRSPLRPELFRLAIVLLFSTGIRHRELRRLTVADYDPSEATLFIRASKFHKSRVLPVASDVKREINHFLKISRAHVSIAPDTPLLWHWYKGIRAYSWYGVLRNVRVLCKLANITTADGSYPRIHDFRHSFAVNVLLRWYRSGIDVQSKLPFLSAYMGHVDINSTYYYLHFVEPLASLVSDRFAIRYGSLVAAGSSSEDAR